MRRDAKRDITAFSLLSDAQVPGLVKVHSREELLGNVWNRRYLHTAPRWLTYGIDNT